MAHARAALRWLTRARQRSSQRRHASAHTLQCSWCCAWRSHSRAHAPQLRMQASSCARDVAASGSNERESTRTVSAQISAQSWFSRMQRRRSAALGSARQASAHETHACAHSKAAAIASPMPGAFARVGLVDNIRSIVCIAHSSRVGPTAHCGAGALRSLGLRPSKAGSVPSAAACARQCEPTDRRDIVALRRWHERALPARLQHKAPAASLAPRSPRSKRALEQASARAGERSRPLLRVARRATASGGRRDHQKQGAAAHRGARPALEVATGRGRRAAPPSRSPPR